MSELVKLLAPYGLQGLVIAALAWYVLRLQKKYDDDSKAWQDRLDEETKARLEDANSYAKKLQEAGDARLADAKAFGTQALDLQHEVVQAIEKMSDLVDLVQGKRAGSIHD
jgi:hypothetical protein